MWLTAPQQQGKPVALGSCQYGRTVDNGADLLLEAGSTKVPASVVQFRIVGGTGSSERGDARPLVGPRRHQALRAGRFCTLLGVPGHGRSGRPTQPPLCSKVRVARKCPARRACSGASPSPVFRPAPPRSIAETRAGGTAVVTREPDPIGVPGSLDAAVTNTIGSRQTNSPLRRSADRRRCLRCVPRPVHTTRTTIASLITRATQSAPSPAGRCVCPAQRGRQ